ncbi:MAG: phytoene desaturase family protein [Actinomycetota bacterium]
MADLSYDVAVVGAGHNGLTLACYLQRAGLRVGVFELAEHVGGGASTEEVTLPGFRHNLHSMLHYWISYGPTFRELDLPAHGVTYVYPEAQYALVFRDGRSLVLYKDLERTCAQIAAFSKRDADAYRDLYRRFESMLPMLMEASFVPPMPPSTAPRFLEQSIEGLEMLRMQQSSPKTLLEETFESDEVKAWIGLMVAQGGHPYDVEGASFMVIGSFAGVHLWPFGLCVGGSRELAEGMARAFREGGGEIHASAPVQRIVVEDGRAAGLELADGRTVEATRAVASNVEVRPTMLDLVGESRLDPDFARKVKRYKSDAIVLFTPHLALNEAPRYAVENRDVDECFAVGWGVESTEDLESQFEDARMRRFPSRPGGMSFSPSVLDPSQAPPGKHTAFVWQLTSYHLPWDEEKRAFGDRLMDEWRDYAPNLTPDNILSRFDYSPRDIERSNPSMVEGGAVHGDITPDQMGPFRPIPGFNYRMPIDGLYLCGGSTHPMGGIIGACGRNAATVLADDLGIERWWKLPTEEPGSVWAALAQPT